MLLEQMEIDHVVDVKPIEEIYNPTLQGEEITSFLAQQKGRAFQKDLDLKQLVITADTIVWFEGKALGKPKNKKDAKQMLQSLSGKTHQVITSVCFTSLSLQHTISCFTDVTFTKLTEENIDSYVHSESPLDKAGSYGIQDSFGLLAVAEINGSYTNVMGLPCMQTYEALTEFIRSAF
jgi:septum formation protein